MSSDVTSFEAQVAKIPRIRRMIDVERQKSNTLQGDILPLGAESLQMLLYLDRSEVEVAQFQTSLQRVLALSSTHTAYVR